MFREELAGLSRVYLNAEGVFRASISNVAPRSSDEIKKQQPFSDRMWTAFDNSASFWENFSGEGSVGHWASFLSIGLALFVSNPFTGIAAMNVGIAALAAFGVKAASIATNLADKKAFQDSLLESLKRLQRS